MKTFHELPEPSAVAHGHLRPGQVMGVRMAILGCCLIGLGEPARRDQIKKRIVNVEMDRCAADWRGPCDRGSSWTAAVCPDLPGARRSAADAARWCATGGKSSQTGGQFASPAPKHAISATPGRWPGPI
jgi:hypothetical protein